MNIFSLDHVVFNVADAERSVAFYCDVLGLAPERLEAFRRGTVPFPSVRVNAATILDFFPPAYSLAAPGGQNVNHLALTVSQTARQLEAYLRGRGVEIVREMTGNFGAQGDNAHAFHVFDPDGNRLELHTYEV